MSMSSIPPDSLVLFPFIPRQWHAFASILHLHVRALFSEQLGDILVFFLYCPR